ncbi:factor of DNA methylation [Trifolium repens]|nr:factor of DNA methylation [Trifolium repens]
MFSNIFNLLTRVTCYSGSMYQKVGLGVIYVVTKRTTIYRIRDFKIVVIILQFVVISTLIVFQIKFMGMFRFFVHNNNMFVITNPDNRNWFSSLVVAVVVVFVVVVNLYGQSGDGRS